MESSENFERLQETSNKEETFKKPTILIGKVGKLPRKTVPSNNLIITENREVNDNNTEEKLVHILEQKEKIEDEKQNVTEIKTNQEPIPVPPKVEILPKNTVCPYIEPLWSSLPVADKDYMLEVLKSGVIIENINLMTKPYWVIGRQPICDISLAHPTISRNHAVIQYKSESSEDLPSGFYVYDLESTHGTFLNKYRIKPRIYVRIQVGHMLKFGCSTRTFLMNGPEEDTELESELTITELKEKRAEELRQRIEKEREEKEKAEREKEKREKEEQEKGIDWGMGEDADEETDLTINPYAETANEQLYLDDPKKALRGFFEREGLELQYECNEKGMGQFLCTVDLPIDDANGRPITAEALVKGKKKEAVVQCALEACRVLDRHGLLRQAVHESKKRKAKNWEENDYYDSDEDTFLDRTGTIEKKREKRMKAKQQQQPETYQTLVVKEKDISEKINSLENQLSSINEAKKKREQDSETDSLDNYMKELADPKLDKYAIAKIKNELTQLRKEHTETVKLVNLTRPANLPPLIPQEPKQQSSTSSKELPKKVLPIFGKRLKVKVMLPSREKPSTVTAATEVREEEEKEEEEEEENEETKGESKELSTLTDTNKHSTEEVNLEERLHEENNDKEHQVIPISSNEEVASELRLQESNSEHTTVPETDTNTTQNDLEQASSSQYVSNSPESPQESRKEVLDLLEIKMLHCDSKALASLDNKVKTKISKTVVKLRKIAEEEESIVVDEKRLAVKKKKLLEQVNRPSEDTNMDKKIKQLSNITSEYCDIGDRKLKMVNKINKLAEDINKIAKEIRIASKLQREQAINRMKVFVEKAHKQQLEIYKELNKLEKSTTDQKVLEKLKTLHSWLTEQKSTMLENLEKLKTTQITENSQMFEEIMKFEENADCFITTILAEIRRMQDETSKTYNNSPDKISSIDLREAGGSKRNLDEIEDHDTEDSAKKKNKNLRRINQRQEKAELEKKKQYEEDAMKEDYNMWVPPKDQTGDGRTSLNEKFGY